MQTCLSQDNSKCMNSVYFSKQLVDVSCGCDLKDLEEYQNGPSAKVLSRGPCVVKNQNGPWAKALSTCLCAKVYQDGPLAGMRSASPCAKVNHDGPSGAAKGTHVGSLC